MGLFASLWSFSALTAGANPQATVMYSANERFLDRQQVTSLARSGELYFPNLPPSSRGITFDLDPNTGQPVPRRQLFTGDFNLDTGSPDWDIQLVTFAGGEVQSHHYEASVEAGMEIWFLNSYQTFTASEEFNSTAMGTKLAFVVRTRYPRASIAPTQVLSWDPLALQILSNTTLSPAARAQEWLNAGFGRYVAFATELDGHVGITVELMKTNSFLARGAFCSRGADLLGIAKGAWRIGAVAHQAQSTYGLDVKMIEDGIPSESGLTPLSLPSTSNLDTIDKQSNWLNNDLLPRARQAKKPHGLYLMPVRDFVPYSLQLGANAYDPSLLATATQTAQEGIDALMAVTDYLEPFALRNLLSSRTYPGSSPQASYWTVLTNARTAVRSAMTTLLDATVAYVRIDNQSNPAARQAVEDAMPPVYENVRALERVAGELRLLGQTLPPIQMSLTSHWTAPGGTGHYDAPLSATVTGAFFLGGVTAGERMEEMLEILKSRYTSQIYSLDYYALPYAGPGMFENIIITSTPVDTVTGPNAGLTTVSFDATTRVAGSMHRQEVIIRDMLRASEPQLFFW